MRAALLVSAAILMVAPMAYADPNSQYQSGDANAVTTITVGSTVDAGATSVASGNVASATVVEDEEDIVSTQHMDGSTSATTDATVWHAEGNIAAASAAVGNGATAVATEDSGLYIDSTQLNHGDATAATRFTGAESANAGTSASASGNVTALSLDHSGAALISNQESIGNVSAVSEADHGIVYGQAVSGSVASANNLSVGGETATVLTAVTQSASGSVEARSDLYTGYAYDASGNATANANATTIDNQWGYVNARVSQNSDANVRADSYVTLSDAFVGFGSAGAYGVGNQAMISNVGSDTVVDVTQVNSGDVSANAALVGDGGQSALASAAAYGNNNTAALCAYCDDNVPTLSTSNDQTNAGDVYARASVTAPRARLVGATSSAIGNAATYQTSGPN
jgi:hypothetical protein